MESFCEVITLISCYENLQETGKLRKAVVRETRQ